MFTGYCTPAAHNNYYYRGVSGGGQHPSVVTEGEYETADGGVQVTAEHYQAGGDISIVSHVLNGASWCLSLT